jgi:hypothetical protein
MLESSSEINLVYPLSVEIDSEGTELRLIESDINTKGLALDEAIVKVAQNLSDCTAIHGIFRSSILRKIPLKRIVGFDFLILFLTAIYGEIRCTKEIRFYRRTIRIEDSKSRIRRWQQSGMFDIGNYDPFVVLVKSCILIYLKKTKQEIIKRPITSYKLAEIFTEKFNIRYIDLLKCMVNI